MRTRPSALRIAALLAGLASAAPFAGAQETAARPDAPEAVAAAPSPWSTSCSGARRAEPLSCAIEQRLIVQETGQTLMTISVRVAAAGAQPVLVIRTPLGVHLPAGLSLRVDDVASASLAFADCNAEGCRAEAEIAEPVLEALAAGRMLNLTMHTAPDQTMTFEIPLGDFADAYAMIL